MIKQQIPVILDTAALHHFILDEAMEIVRCINEAQLKVIVCVADRDLRNSRLRNRPYQSTGIRIEPATIPDCLRLKESLVKNKDYIIYRILGISGRFLSLFGTLLHTIMKMPHTSHKRYQVRLIGCHVCQKDTRLNL